MTKHTTRLQPAASVVDAIGSQSLVARIAKVNKSSVNKWLKPKSQHGTGGIIPAEYMGPLLVWALQNNRPLTPAMFVKWPKRFQPPDSFV